MEEIPLSYYSSAKTLNYQTIFNNFKAIYKIVKVT